VAQKTFESDQELKDEINEDLSQKVTGKIRIMGIVELLLKTLESNTLKKKISKKLKTLRPACYYGCMQTRFPVNVPVPDNVENPQGMEKIMQALGAKPLDWSYKTDCCGASAAVNDPDIALMLMSKILKDAVSRGADCLVTSCPMCQLNLDYHQEKIKEKYGITQSLPVYFITEMFGLSMGISPGKLQIKRHVVNGMTRLEELPLL